MFICGIYGTVQYNYLRLNSVMKSRNGGMFLNCVQLLLNMLWHCWLGSRKGIRPVKTEWWDVGVVVWGGVQTCIWPSWCHCHSLCNASVNPDWFALPGFTFLVPAHPGSPGQSPGGHKMVVVVVVVVVAKNWILVCESICRTSEYTGLVFRSLMTMKY